MPGIDAWANLLEEANSADAWLDIASPLGKQRYLCEVRKRMSRAAVGPVIASLQNMCGADRRPLLVCSYISEAVAEELVQRGIEFVDSVGNIYLSNPFAYVRIQGNRPPASLPKGKFTATALKLIYVLLQNEGAFGATSRELAGKGGVSLGTVSHVLRNLSQLGYLQRRRKGDYCLLSGTDLRERWEIGYAEELRPKIFLGTYSPTGSQSFEELSKALLAGAETEGYLVGGDLGAAVATEYLRPQTVVMHVDPKKSRQLMVKLRLKPDKGGSIAVLSQFGMANAWVKDCRLADPLLLRAELLWANDERLRETAEVLLDRFIGVRSRDV
ncbi:MAG: type IV toxin-antitoxin system AbiEi family antitoxin [Cyanobacteria bacterium P01_G01_bin.4]